MIKTPKESVLTVDFAPYGVDALSGKAHMPHPTQKLVLEWVDKVRAGQHGKSGIPVLYLQHGVASGGTRAILAPVIECLFAYPGLRCLIGRKDYQDLRLSVMETFFEIMPRILVMERDEQEHRYTIRGTAGDATVFFRELKDVRGLGSQEFGIIVVSEAHEIDLTAYRTLKQRCRQQGMPLMLLMEGNPPSMGHWLGKITDPNDPEFDSDIDRIILSSYENWNFMPPSYRSSLEGMPHAWRRRFLLGETAAMPSGTAVYPSFVDTVHVMKTPILNDRPILRGWDFGLRRAACYDKETEVLTDIGWKKFADVKVGDVACTLNPHTKAIEYQPVQATINYPYTGKMFHWKEERNVGYDVRVTEDHMMVADVRRKRPDHRELRFFTAKQLSEENSKYKNRLWFLRTGRWQAGENVSVRLPLRRSAINGGFKVRSEVLWPLENYAEFMGLYLSEGSTTASKKYPSDLVSSHYNTTVWQKENDPVMAAVLEKTPFRFTRMKEKHHGWRTASAQLYDHLKPFGYAQDKFVPKAIRSAPCEIIQKFLSMYERGDGSQQGDHIKVTTSSKQMADDLQELYLKCGYAARVSEDHNPHYTQGVVYTVSRLKTYAMRIHPKNLTVEDVVNEPVYCVTVPNHTLYVRRNGRAMWCGNCVWGQMSDDGRLLIHNEWLPMETPEEQFIDGVLMRSNMWFGQRPYRDFGDPAARNRDPHGVNTLTRLQKKGIQLQYRVTTYGERIPLINHRLSLMVNGKPAIQIDPKCQTLIEGLLGGYHYPELKPDQEFSLKKDEPYRDGYFEHVANAWEYLCVNLFGRASPTVATYIRKRNEKTKQMALTQGSAVF